MLAHGVGHGIARLDVEHHFAHDGLQRLVFRLASQNVQRLHERQTGVDLAVWA